MQQDLEAMIRIHLINNAKITTKNFNLAEKHTVLMWDQLKQKLQELHLHLLLITS